MPITLLIKVHAGFRTQRFRNIQEALEVAHQQKIDLYEDDEDSPNLIYSPSWDKPTCRAVWRTLLSSFGMSPYNRKALPKELSKGTMGPDFEVN